MSHSNIQKHGSIPFNELRQMGIDPSEIIDFSATVNPYPLPQAVSKLVTCENISAYPDSECHDAINAVASYLGVTSKWIAITAGMTETIFILPRIFKKAIYFSPTYGDYTDAYKRNELSLQSVAFPLFEDDFKNVIEKLRYKDFQLLMICNPNNPNGYYLKPWQICELCKKFSNSVICIDESYQEMGKDCESIISFVSDFPNLLVLKSLTKPFGIGGLRAAYLVCSDNELINKIKNFLLPWGVSSPALRVIPAIFENIHDFQLQWKLIHEDKSILEEQFKKIDINVSDGCCPFLLAYMRNSSELRLHLLEKYHFAVRDCSSFGLKDTLRIMPSLESNNCKLVEALGDCKNMWLE